MKNQFRLAATAMSFVMLLVCFSSCQKDDLEQIKPEIYFNHGSKTAAKQAYNNINPSKRTDTSNEDCDCFDIFENIDWEADEEVVIAALEEILENLSDAELEAMFTPVCTEDEIYENACIADCEGITGYQICTEDQLEEWFEDQEWSDGCGDLCFDFNFPVQVELPNGSIETANTEDELDAIFENWFEENGEPSETNEPMFVYPIDITLEDGTTQTLENEEDFEEQLEACFGEHEEEEFDLCFDFNFPITVIFPDSTNQIANDEENFENIIDTWFDNNPDSEEFPTLDFPIEVTIEDDVVQTINNEEELDDLIENCFEGLVMPDNTLMAIRKIN